MVLNTDSDRFTILAISKSVLVLKRPGHFATYLSRVNEAVFCYVALVVKKAQNRFNVLAVNIPIVLTHCLVYDWSVDSQ